VAFRGVNCSDAAGGEVGYAGVMRLLAANATTAPAVDWSTASPHFNYRHAATGALHQVWYDDAASLAVKYAVAKAMGVRGVGPYRYDQLDYSGSAQSAPQTKAMWAALAGFAMK
jgi:di-N-acetylchitobiase